MHLLKGRESMLVILEKTPLWVFVLFVALIFLGYTQSKDREVGYYRALLVPCGMFIFSLYGVFSSFGWGMTWLFWLIGSLVGIALGLRLSMVHALVYVPQRHSFIIKGSWLWFMLIMILFFIKYTVGVMMARHVELVYNFTFEAIVSFLYGCLSGIFFARVIVLKHVWKKNKKLENI